MNSFQKKLGICWSDGKNSLFMSCYTLILTSSCRYGAPPTPLPRQTIARGINKNIISIELHPPKFRIYLLTKDDASSQSSLLEPVTITLSTHATLKDLCSASTSVVQTSTATDLPPSRVWRLGDANFNHPTRDLPVSKLAAAEILDATADESKTLEAAAFESGDSFVVEFQDATTREWLVKNEAEAPAQPLFKSNDGFFNRMSASTSSIFSGSNTKSNNDAKAEVDKKMALVKKEKLKEKERWIEPGTLGLGNM